MSTRFARRTFAALFTTTALIAMPAMAQDAPADDTAAEDSTDIIVTAQKRSESLQNVPISIQALEKLGLVVCDDTKDWKTTWTGAGVSNWRTQLRFAEDGQVVAEPEVGENGHQPGPEC